LLVRLQPLADVARGRPVNPRDLHVAAERERGDAVLDAVTHPLDERRPEAEVELARRHPDRPRDDEVTGLVGQDEDGEPENREARAHAGSATRSRALRSASTSSSRSRAGEPSTRASTSSTAAAMSRKPRRPSRNARTATSLAALNA